MAAPVLMVFQLPSASAGTGWPDICVLAEQSGHGSDNQIVHPIRPRRNAPFYWPVNWAAISQIAESSPVGGGSRRGGSFFLHLAFT